MAKSKKARKKKADHDKDKKNPPGRPGWAVGRLRRFLFSRKAKWEVASTHQKKVEVFYSALTREVIYLFGYNVLEYPRGQNGDREGSAEGDGDGDSEDFDENVDGYPDPAEFPVPDEIHTNGLPTRDDITAEEAAEQCEKHAAVRRVCLAVIRPYPSSHVHRNSCNGATPISRNTKRPPSSARCASSSP